MIKVAHSPDTDDFFFFWAIVTKKINLEGLTFAFEQFDTQTLNQLPATAEYDVIAVSVAAYPEFANKYLTLSHGASVGRNYGPVIVSDKNLAVKDLSNICIGIPGTSTTAARILQLLAPQAKTVSVSIDPYEQIFEVLANNKVDAILLIHEGQLTYSERGLELIVDLGKWWSKHYGLPLPLGINVIKRALGAKQIRRISKVLKHSIRYALDNQEHALAYLLDKSGTRSDNFNNREKLKSYLSMYANEDSYELQDDCVKALDILWGTSAQVFITQ